MQDDTAISVRGLTRVFVNSKKIEKRAVDDISFEVRKGEIFGILGPNGAGKTTTIKMLSTLLLPTSGNAFVLGMDISSKKCEKELRSRINVVSGGERGLYYRLTGRQNLEYFGTLYGIPKVELLRRIDDLLELVGMTQAADERVENYSRGMKQRIHIARALVNDPDVLFLDEPTIGLDPEISRNIRDIVRKLAHDGTTVILTTHYMHEAEELCDRMVILSSGRIVGYGTSQELNDAVADTEMVRIVTTRDPHGAIRDAEAIPGVRNVTVQSLTGRFETSIHVDKRSELLGKLTAAFDEFGIRSAGYDRLTLEDIYLHLTGGE